jgi:hypothetical protein
VQLGAEGAGGGGDAQGAGVLERAGQQRAESGEQRARGD